MKDTHLQGRGKNKKMADKNRSIQVDSFHGKKNKTGGYISTYPQKKYFKKYLQLSLFPDIVPNIVITPHINK